MIIPASVAGIIALTCTAQLGCALTTTLTRRKMVFKSFFPFSSRT
jgi:hypothetical protein